MQLPTFLFGASSASIIDATDASRSDHFRATANVFLLLRSCCLGQGYDGYPNDADDTTSRADSNAGGAIVPEHFEGASAFAASQTASITAPLRSRSYFASLQRVLLQNSIISQAESRHAGRCRDVAGLIMDLCCWVHCQMA